MNRLHHILHIDPCPLILTGLKALIDRRTGLFIYHHSTDLSALMNLNRDLKPDLIICDIEGAEHDTFRQLHELSFLQGTKLLIHTFSLQQNHVLHSLRCGVRGYILKNSPADFLFQSIECILQGQKCLSPEVQRIVDSAMDVNHLTARELDVLQLVATGKRNRTIADKLCISEWTVKSHMKNIMGKLDARSRTDAVSKAVSQGIVQLRV